MMQTSVTPAVEATVTVTMTASEAERCGNLLLNCADRNTMQYGEMQRLKRALLDGARAAR